MRQRRLSKIAVPFLIGAMALSACGSDDPEGGPTDTGKVVKIGLIVPLSGDLSALGLGMKNSVQLAIDQANTAKKVAGYTIELADKDDEAKADVGARKAAELASDDQVAAVIGTLNSSVAEQVQPVLDRESIAMVSPANTNPTLTQGKDFATAKKRTYNSYFRVSTTDAIQGPFAANYASNDIKAKKVALVHDTKTYGKGLAEAFAQQFVKNGGEILNGGKALTVNADDKDFTAIASQIARLDPDLVYYGGEYPACSLLSSQLRDDIPVMGGDGIYSGTFITTGKAKVEGDYATSVGAPVEELATAATFVSDYAAKSFKEPYEAYGAYAYDAANVIIDALAKTLAGKDVKAARGDIVTAIQATSRDGVTGKIAFDEYGDTTTKVLTVYQVKGQKWVPAKTDAFS